MKVLKVLLLAVMLMVLALMAPWLFVWSACVLLPDQGLREALRGGLVQVGYVWVTWYGIAKEWMA